MDAVATEHVVAAFRRHWGLEFSRVDRTRSVMLVTASRSRLVVRLLPTRAAKLMVDVLDSAKGLSGSVPLVVPDHSGSSFVPISNDIVLTVTTFLPGSQPKELRSTLAAKIGSIVARLHEASAAMAARGQRFGRDIAGADWLRATTNWPVVDPVTNELRTWALSTYPQVIDDYMSLPLAIGHGDIQQENIAVADDVGLYDFGSCYLGARVLDLANAVANLAGRSGELDELCAAAVIKGYTDYVDLTELEANLLPVVLTLDLIRIIAWIDTAGRSRLDAGELHDRRDWRVKLARSLIDELDSVRRTNLAKATLSSLVEAFR